MLLKLLSILPQLTAVGKKCFFHENQEICVLSTLYGGLMQYTWKYTRTKTQILLFPVNVLLHKLEERKRNIKSLCGEPVIVQQMSNKLIRCTCTHRVRWLCYCNRYFLNKKCLCLNTWSNQIFVLHTKAYLCDDLTVHLPRRVDETKERKVPGCPIKAALSQ